MKKLVIALCIVLVSACSTRTNAEHYRIGEVLCSFTRALPVEVISEGSYVNPNVAKITAICDNGLTISYEYDKEAEQKAAKEKTPGSGT